MQDRRRTYLKRQSSFSGEFEQPHSMKRMGHQLAPLLLPAVVFTQVQVAPFMGQWIVP